MLCVILLAAGSLFMLFPTSGDPGLQSLASTALSVRANLAPWENTTAPLQDYGLPEDFGEDEKHINLKQAFQDDDTVNNLTFDFEYQAGGGKIKVYDISNAAGTVITAASMTSRISSCTSPRKHFRTSAESSSDLRLWPLLLNE